MRSAIVVCLLVLTGTAVAEPVKHRRTAVALIAGGALAAGAIVAGGALAPNESTRDALLSTGLTGLLIAPSLGHLYADELVTGGMLLRVAGVATLGVATGTFGEKRRDSSTLAGVGIAAIACGAIWDLATTGGAVDRWNRGPTLLAMPHGAGLGVAGGF